MQADGQGTRPRWPSTVALQVHSWKLRHMGCCCMMHQCASGLPCVPAIHWGCGGQGAPGKGEGPAVGAGLQVSCQGFQPALAEHAGLVGAPLVGHAGAALGAAPPWVQRGLRHDEVRQLTRLGHLRTGAAVIRQAGSATSPQEEWARSPAWATSATPLPSLRRAASRMCQELAWPEGTRSCEPSTVAPAAALPYSCYVQAQTATEQLASHTCGTVVITTAARNFRNLPPHMV